MGMNIWKCRLKKFKENDYCIDMFDEDTLEYDNKNFPEWTKKYETETYETFFDFEKVAKRMNLDLVRLDWIMFDHFEFYESDNPENSLTIEFDDMPTISANVVKIGYDILGDISADILSENFYNDIEETYYILTVGELNAFNEKYVKEKYREKFKKTVTDDFIEGENVIVFNV